MQLEPIYLNIIIYDLRRYLPNCYDTFTWWSFGSLIKLQNNDLEIHFFCVEKDSNSCIFSFSWWDNSMVKKIIYCNFHLCAIIYVVKKLTHTGISSNKRSKENTIYLTIVNKNTYWNKWGINVGTSMREVLSWIWKNMKEYEMTENILAYKRTICLGPLTSTHLVRYECCL